MVVKQTPAEDVPSGSLAETDVAHAWWRVAITIAWNWDEEPDWYLDMLLADQAYVPALAERREQIGLWRFHRRAAPDAAGHRFSLLVYTDEVTAGSLYREIRDNPTLQRLESEGRIDSVKLVSLVRSDLPPVAHSSDRSWPPEIQASWPWYIMGVSQTWLSLINEVKVENAPEDGSTAELLVYYGRVNNRVSALWRDHGQHVYLHHLNALFGYAPLIVRETNLKRY